MAAKKLGPDDAAYFYLMAPAPKAKEAFADWVVRPERGSRETFAAFEGILAGLKALVEAREASEGVNSS